MIRSSNEFNHLVAMVIGFSALTIGMNHWNQEKICEASSGKDELFEELIQELQPVQKDGNNLEIGYILKVIEIV